MAAGMAGREENAEGWHYGANLHSLRHTHAAALLSRGILAVFVGLGHADPNITLKLSGIRCLDDLGVAEAWDRLIIAR